MNKIAETIEFYLKTHNLLNETVIVAFSGGYDSMCLLDVVNKLKVKTVAAHLNHNWRGQESLEDAKLCEKFCSAHNIEFYTETLSDDIEKTETAARAARYEFLQRTAQKYNSKCVLTAHNADDNAETVLYRVIKGTGTYGLEGIKEQRGIFYRPMLSIYRKDIEQYCKDNNLTPCYDSSNDNTKYKRNLIRHEILTVMKTINKDVKQAVNSLSQIAKEENKIIDELLPDIENLKTSAFLSYSKALQSRIVHKLLRLNNIDYDKEKIENITDFINLNSKSKSGVTTSLTTDLWLFVNNNKICIVTKNNQAEILTEINGCGEYTFAGKTFVMEECCAKPDIFPGDCEYTAYVDLRSVEFPLQLRTRKDGDFIQPFGINGSQKLKKYLNNKKIPKHEKNNLIFLCKGQEVLWAAGLGISDKIKVTNEPTHRLKIIK